MRRGQSSDVRRRLDVVKSKKAIVDRTPSEFADGPLGVPVIGGMLASFYQSDFADQRDGAQRESGVEWYHRSVGEDQVF